MEEADDDDSDHATSSLRPSVFDMLQPSTSHQSRSMFNNMGNDKAPKPFVFQILKRDRKSKSSALTRIIGERNRQVHHLHK